MRLTPVLRSQPFPWLAGLKSVQLQRVARATGIQSSGTNGVLVNRIQTTLAPYLPQSEGGILDGGVQGAKPMSVLSIDMGIQNLAFAHLRVPAQTQSQYQSKKEQRPTLTAWRRLAMSEISTLDPDSYLAPGGVEDVMNLSSRSSSISSSEDILSAENSSETAKERSRSRSTKDKKEKESFCPALYAKNAYSLINTLLSTYKPTHILIERQRFRSAGGSAVQEWTIRVGVFEGMLYAVLETILQERGLSKNLAPMQIHGIEPKRVVKYWIDKERGGEKMTAREVKKAKIEIVGKWLEEGRVGVVEGDVTELVGGYLGKLRKEGKNTVQIGKLDDLADCLLQGVTWLEWEGMRRRLGRDGFGGLEG